MGCTLPSGVPITVSAVSPTPYSFRYELDLCTLPEGTTLSQWRQATKNETTPAEMSPSAHTRSRLIHLLRRKRRPATS